MRLPRIESRSSHEYSMSMWESLVDVNRNLVVASIALHAFGTRSLVQLRQSVEVARASK